MEGKTIEELNISIPFGINANKENKIVCLNCVFYGEKYFGILNLFKNIFIVHLYFYNSIYSTFYYSSSSPSK